MDYNPQKSLFTPIFNSISSLGYDMVHFEFSMIIETGNFRII